MGGQIVSDWEQNNTKPQSIPPGKKKLVSIKKEEQVNMCNAEFAQYNNTQPLKHLGVGFKDQLELI